MGKRKRKSAKAKPAKAKGSRAKGGRRKPSAKAKFLDQHAVSQQRAHARWARLCGQGC